jgi:hypothetical protein
MDASQHPGVRSGYQEIALIERRAADGGTPNARRKQAVK